MVNIKFFVFLSAVLVVLSIGGCTNSSSTNPNTTTAPETTIDYSNLFLIDELPDNFSRTTVSEINSILGQPLPTPTYLPEGYQIKEIYHHLKNILVLISDQPVQWTGKQYRCRLAFYTEWGGVSGGFKWAEGEVQYLPGTDNLSVLVNEGEQNILWWQNYSTYIEGYARKTALLSLYANREFPKDELIQIAVSVPEILPPTEPLSESTATPRPATPSPDEPPPFTLPPD